jgi:DNA-binding XRE family transcriptional regulator
VAKNLGISYQTMWLIETGRHIPGDEIKEKLSAYYGIPVSRLFYGEKVNGK